MNTPLADLILLQLYLLALMVLGYLTRKFLKGVDPAALPLGIAKSPYLVAYLRGGKNEALRIAVISLIERGLLKQTNGMLVADSAHATERPQFELEREILNFFAVEKKATTAFEEKRVFPSLVGYRQYMRDEGLHLEWHARLLRSAICLPVGAIGFVIGLALSHMTNDYTIEFIISCIGKLCVGLAFFVPFIIFRRIISPRGKKTLQALQTLHKNQRANADNLQHLATPGEVQLLTAIFGLGVLPAFAFAYVGEVFPRHAKNKDEGASSSGCSSCSSTACSSDSGSSGDSGCGSSGCGGGGD